MKADLVSAYAASLARVASWAVIAGLIFRSQGDVAFAAFSFTRAIVSAIAVTGLGIAPALTILLPRFDGQRRQTAGDNVTPPEKVSDYFSPRTMSEVDVSAELLGAGIQLIVLVTAVLTAAWSIGLNAEMISRHNGNQFWEVLSGCIASFGLGTMARVLGDVAGSRLQTDGRLALDNWLQTTCELFWIGLVVLHASRGSSTDTTLNEVGRAYLYSGAIVATVRSTLAIVPARLHRHPFRMAKAVDVYLLLRTGGMLMLAQVADLLYGPANQGIIRHYFTSGALATYAPLLHIDAALLLGVGGLAALLLPRTAIAIGAGEPGLVRRYYINGTIASFTLLAAGAAVAWAFAPRLFSLWFGDPLPATAALLPLVMIHTVIGGSAGVGRAVLFGLNRAKAYTAAALIGGAANVGLAIFLVTHTSLGLRAIVLATIITVAIRCGLWMPWYILRSLARETAELELRDAALAAAPVIP